MSDSFPSPEEIQKEFEEFARHRFGANVRVFQPEVRPMPSALGALEFKHKPRDVKDYLDRFVIGQDGAKKALAIAVCDHYRHIAHTHAHDDEAYAKQNVLLLGPTGVGKTYLVKQIARLVGVPFVKADATRFSETGYVGANVDDLVRDLMTAADGDLERAQLGIVYLDEVDKLASAGESGGRDVSGRGVQFGLLKLMEETEVDLTSGSDPRSQLQLLIDAQRGRKPEKKVFNTRNVLFIVSGAFHGLEGIVRQRIGAEALGFHRAGKAQEREDGLLAQARTEDFVRFGFEPEFVGRLPVRVACHELGEEELFAVLRNSEGSIVRQYERAFADYGIATMFTDAALREIAKLAEVERTGARSLMTVCERTLREFKYELPSSAVREFVVSKELVQNPTAILRRLVDEPGYRQLELDVLHIHKFEDDFFRVHGMRVKFDEPATRLIHERATRRRTAARTVCEETLIGWEHGLKLVQQTTGQAAFPLGVEAVESPKAVLEKLVMCGYRRPSGLSVH